MSYIKQALIAVVCLCVSGFGGTGQIHEVQGVSDPNMVSTMDWVIHTQATLDRPLSEVWPVFKDIGRWYTEYTYEVMSGPSYEAASGMAEDQVLRVTPSNGFPRASGSKSPAENEYFVQKTLKVVPPREIVALLSGSAFDLKRYTQFYVWRLTEKGKTTTVLVDCYGEAELVKPLPKAEFSAYYEKLMRNFNRSWSDAFQNLRKTLGEH